MKLVTVFAAGLALGLLGSAPAAAQDRHDQDRHDQGMRGDRDHDGMRGDRDRDDHGRHMGWRNHRHCHWVWRHHHRMRVC
jgi:hypothetical protein